MGIRDMMARDHKDCDELFTVTEKVANEGDWPATTQSFNQFIKSMECHLAMEEEVLFPAFENATGMTQGPTMVMRMEHEQMRELFAQMREALEEQNGGDFLGQAETLLILMQQHNAKEEQMLYPMMDDALPESVDDLVTSFQERKSR